MINNNKIPKVGSVIKIRIEDTEGLCDYACIVTNITEEKITLDYCGAIVNFKLKYLKCTNFKEKCYFYKNHTKS